jgi:hypothetical protein
MPKEKTAKEVFEECVNKGMYEEANLDRDEVEKVKTLAMEDYEFGKSLRKIDKPNYRILYNINYDVLRELCDQLIKYKKQKISNHQGLFAFIILHYPELELDWKFFETIRKIRNQNKYLGRDISQETWKNSQLPFDIYIATIKKEIEKRLKESD